MYIELMTNVARMMLQNNARDDEILKKTQITEQQLNEIKEIAAKENQDKNKGLSENELE